MITGWNDSQKDQQQYYNISITEKKKYSEKYNLAFLGGETNTEYYHKSFSQKKIYITVYVNVKTLLRGRS